MDDLEKLLNEYNEMVKKDLYALAAEQNGDLNIHLRDLGLIFVSNAIAFAVNQGASKEHLKAVSDQCLDIIEEEQRPKIIC